MPVQDLAQTVRGQMFRGVNMALPAERLPSSDFQISDNLWIIGGELWTRPGRRGMFAQALPGAIYALTAYASEDTSMPPNYITWLMFVSSGKLYIAQAGASIAPTEIKIGGTGGTSFALNSPTVRMQRVGEWMYIVDGVGALYKVKIPYTNASTSYTAEVYTGLYAPTSAFTAALTNQVIDSMSDASKWSSFPALSWPGSTSVNNPEMIMSTASQQFSGGTGSPSPHPTGWLNGGDSTGYQSPSGSGVGNDLYLDGGVYPEWADYDFPTPTYAAGANTIGNARVFVASAYGHSTAGGQFALQIFPEDASVLPTTLHQGTDLQIISSGASSTVSSATYTFVSGDANKILTIFSGTDVTTPGNYTITSVAGGIATINGNPGTAGGHTNGVWSLGLDAGGAGTLNPNNTLNPPPSAITGADQSSPAFKCSGANQQFSQVFSFTGLSKDFDYIKLRIIGPASNSGTGVNTPSLRVVDVGIVCETSSNGVLHLRAKQPNGVNAGYNCLGGCWIKRDYTGSPGGYVDYSQSNTISVHYSAPTTSGQIPFRFGFLKAGTSMGTDGANIQWSNQVTYTSDGSAFYCDCSTIDPTVRAQTAYLFIQIVSDLPSTINPADLCTLGPISTSGNLTLHELYGGWGGDYSYQWTKMNAANDPTNFIDVVESDPSPMSTPPMQPNGVSNQVTFTLPTAGSFSDGTTHLCIYRFGGVFSDGLGRLIARVSLSADQAMDAQHQYTWNHTTGVFVDNTTDSSLETNIPTFLLTGRTPLPNGATSITEWAGRIVATIGSQVYISWLIPSGNNTGLYFNTVNVADPNDVAQSVKGAIFDTGGQDNDPIQAVAVLGPYLQVMKQRSAYMVTGTDAASFQMAPDMVRAGLGLAAPLAWTVMGKNLTWLGSDAVYTYDGSNTPDTMSDDIAPAVNPKIFNGGTPFQPAAYAASFMVWHGRRLFVCLPGSPNDTAPSVLWVWDSRVSGPAEEGGWVPWGYVARNMHFTSATSLTQINNTDDLYFAGMDGQIYQFTGYGDTHLSTDAAAAIPQTWIGRALGQEVTSTFGAEILGPYYFNVQKPEWLQFNIVTKENVTVYFEVTAAACPGSWTHPYQINATQLVIRKEIDGSNVEGVNCTPSVTLESVTPTNIKRVALELSVGSPGVN